MPMVIVFGASITYGAWDREGGWVQRLRKFLDEKGQSGPKSSILYNLGISGDRTENVLERFESETQSRLKENWRPVTLIFDIGVNDSQFIHAEKNLRVPPEKFKGNIQKLISLARKYSPNVVFVGLAPVDEAKVDPIPWSPEKSYRNEYILQYNSIIKSICGENNIHFIEIYERLENYKTLLEDGLHPNSEGHQAIFEIVKDSLLNNRLI